MFFSIIFFQQKKNYYFTYENNNEIQLQWWWWLKKNFDYKEFFPLLRFSKKESKYIQIMNIMDPWLWLWWWWWYPLIRNTITSYSCLNTFFVAPISSFSFLYWLPFSFLVVVVAVAVSIYCHIWIFFSDYSRLFYYHHFLMLIFYSSNWISPPVKFTLMMDRALCVIHFILAFHSHSHNFFAYIGLTFF